MAIAPAVDVDLVHVEAELVHRTKDLEAKASLISMRSRSSVVMPARSSARRDASTGPMPITSGESPVAPVEMMRASGLIPSSLALDVAHHNERRRSVVQGACVPGSHGAVDPEGWLKRSKCLDCGASARPVVVTTVIGEGDGGDFAAEVTRGDRLFGAVL